MLALQEWCLDSIWTLGEKGFPCASASEMKVLDPTHRVGRLGLRESDGSPPRGGSSIVGENTALGEVEKVEAPESETSDGAPSKESALEASEVEGDGSDESMCIGRLDEKFDVIVREG